MIIAVHTTPPPTRNSTSTRNKGPSGLKFCMPPLPEQLTTTQHNLTLLLSGGVIYPPKLNFHYKEPHINLWCCLNNKINIKDNNNNNRNNRNNDNNNHNHNNNNNNNNNNNCVSFLNRSFLAGMRVSSKMNHGCCVLHLLSSATSPTTTLTS